MKIGLREAVAKKASKIVKVAQVEKAPMPKIVDEGPEGAPAPKPPALAGPPKAAPPGPPDEAKIEDKVEKEIKEEKTVADKLDKLVTTMESIVNALADQKKLMEKMVGKPEKEFEKFKEEEKEDELDSFSPEEFGVTPESLIVSHKEDKMSVKSLRDARKARLAGTMELGSGEYGEKKTLADEFSVDKAKGKTFKPQSPAVSITKVKKSEVPGMLKLAQLALELNEGNDTWTVLDVAEEGVDKPLYEIPQTEENKENFATEDFAKEVIQSMKKDGIEEALVKYGAVEVKADILDIEKATPPAPKIDPKPVTELKRTPERAQEPDPVEPVVPNTDFKHRFNRAFRLALSAMNKNLTKNPLKGAFYEILSGLKLNDDQARRVIESAFSKGSAEHFETALAETEKFLDLTDEAFVEMESVIGELDTHIPDTDFSEVDDRAERSAAIRLQASKGSLPLTTASASDPTSIQEALADVLPKPKNAGMRYTD